MLDIAFSAVSIVSAQDSVRLNVDFIDNGQFPVVEAYVSATNFQGFPVKNLSGADFSVSEDGRVISKFEIMPVQNIKQPLAIVISVDTSGSMGGKKTPTPLQNAVQAANVFIESLSPQDQIAVVGFANAPYVVQEFTSDKELLKSKLASLSPGGQTTMYDGIVKAIELLKNRSERKILVLITDGRDTGDGQFDFVSSINEASRWSIPVYPIGFGEVDSKELGKMATLTGGGAQISPDSLGIQSAFNTVLQILREQYLIRYESLISADGKEHMLKISVNGVSSPERAFIAQPGKVTISLDFQDGEVIGGNVLLKPEVLSPAPVEKIEIKLDGSLLQTMISEPFEYAWDSTVVNHGLHEFIFIVTDKAGNTEQAVINLDVQPPIAVGILNPFDGQELSGSNKVISEVKALSGVAKVEYSVDGNILQTLTSPPYEVNINWSDYSKGYHVLQVKATDVNGFSDVGKVNVQAKGGYFWFFIFLIILGIAALGIPIGLRERRNSKEKRKPVAFSGKALLREIEGDNAGKEWLLDVKEVTLGRRHDNDIQLTSPSISRDQAVIKFENGHHVLCNLVRDNPPSVNGVEVQTNRVLHSGDKIRFGQKDQEVILYEW